MAAWSSIDRSASTSPDCSDVAGQAILIDGGIVHSAMPPPARDRRGKPRRLLRPEPSPPHIAHFNRYVYWFR
jgi:hypothetical protein